MWFITGIYKLEDRHIEYETWENMANIAHTHYKPNDFALNLESLGIEFVGRFHATVGH